MFKKSHVNYLVCSEGPHHARACFHVGGPVEAKANVKSTR